MSVIKNIKILPAFALMCLALSACQSEEPISSYKVNGNYVLYGNPYSDGVVEVEAHNEKVYLDVTTFTPGGQGICQWEGEVVPSKKPVIVYSDEKQKNYVEVSFGDGIITLESNNNEMCGIRAYLPGTFLKVGSPAYNEAMGGASPLAPFESIIDGKITAYKVDKDKYTLEINRGVEAYTISGRTSDPFFEQIERTMKWAKIYNKNALPDKIIVDMCTAESSDCGSLRISQSNPVFYQAEAYLTQNLEKTVDATYSTGGEIISMSTHQHFLHGTWKLDYDATAQRQGMAKDSNTKSRILAQIGDVWFTFLNKRL